LSDYLFIFKAFLNYNSAGSIGGAWVNCPLNIGSSRLILRGSTLLLKNGCSCLFIHFSSQRDFSILSLNCSSKESLGFLT